MSKPAAFFVLVSCAVVAAGTLTGCSAGALPGGPLGGAVGTSAQSSDQLVALPKACLTAREVSAFVGFTVPAPTISSKTSSLLCNYKGDSANDSVEITFTTSDRSTDAASIQNEMEAVAASLNEKSTIAALPGYGLAAYTISSKHGAGIEIWNKGVIFSVIDNRSLGGVERVAKAVLASGPGVASATTPAPTKPASKGAPATARLVDVPADCPTAADVSAMLGFSVPDPDAARSSSRLECTYAATSTAGVVQINFHEAPAGTTPASVRAELGDSAATKANLFTVSGIGQAAYASKLTPSGGGILVWNGGVIISITDGKDVASVERAAIGILAE
jgi:hypothetical protein